MIDAAYCDYTLCMMILTELWPQKSFSMAYYIKILCTTESEQTYWGFQAKLQILNMCIKSATPKRHDVYLLQMYLPLLHANTSWYPALVIVRGPGPQSKLV